MTNKDFLNQFSGNDKPDSFKEEERVKIAKTPKQFNLKVLLIVLASILVIVGLVLFFVLRPTIVVKEFVGNNVSEVKAWIKQNGIESQGIIIREEYNFDYDEGYVTYQSIEADKKVRKNVKMDFVVSLGADPDESIKVPDIENMNKDELQKWISDNKLSKTKISTAYSDKVEEGLVISYEFKNSDVDSFTRSSTLNITVSKGPQPAGVITVDNFVGQNYSAVEAWGKANKIVINRATTYSDKVGVDTVVSQSIEAKSTMKEGEILTVVVSLGKGIKVPDFTSMTNNDVDEWIKDNSSYCKVKKVYSNENKYVLTQSIASGRFFGEDTKLELKLNLGNHFYFEDLKNYGVDYSAGSSYDRCCETAESLQEYGLYIDMISKKDDTSDKERGTIINVNRIYDSNGNEYSMLEKLPLTITIEMTISDKELGPIEPTVSDPE